MAHAPQGDGQRRRPRFSLYLASQLTYGVIYVYSRQVDFFHRDLQNFINNYKVSLQSIHGNVQLPPRTNRGKRVVTLDEPAKDDAEFGCIEPPVKRIRTSPRTEPTTRPTVSDDEGFDFDEMMRQEGEPYKGLISPPHLPSPSSPGRSLVVSPEAITMPEPIALPSRITAPTGVDIEQASDDELRLLGAIPDKTPRQEPVPVLPPDAPERLSRPARPSLTPPALLRSPISPGIPPEMLSITTPPSVGQPFDITTPPGMLEAITPPSVGEPPLTTTPPEAPTTMPPEGSPSSVLGELGPVEPVPISSPVLRLLDIDQVERPPRRPRRRRLIVDDEIQLPREEVHRGLVDYRTNQRQSDIAAFRERQNQRTPPNVLFTRPGRPGDFRAPQLRRLFDRRCRRTIEDNFSDSPMRQISPIQVPPTPPPPPQPLPLLPQQDESVITEVGRDPSFDVSRQISEPSGIGTPDISAHLAGDVSGPPVSYIDVDDIQSALPTVPEQEENGATEPPVEDVEVGALTETAAETSSQEETEDENAENKERRAIEALLRKLQDERTKSKDLLTFRQICPPSTVKRVRAAKMFSRLLTMNKLYMVHLEQHAPYDNIYIHI